MIKDDIIIEKMTLGHIDGVLELEKLSFSIPWSRESFVAELTTNTHAIYHVALVGGRVAGYVGMWQVFDEGHITNIAVHPDFRGCGVAKRLLEALIQTACDSGIDAMTLEVRTGNVSAQGLYARYGFMVEGVRKKYYSDTNEDALIMWKHLK